MLGAIRNTLTVTAAALLINLALYSTVSNGRSQPLFPAVVEPASILPQNGGDGSTGFVLNGSQSGQRLGASVAMDGDIDNDGRNDLVTGVPGSSPTATAIVFGSNAAPMGPDGMEMADIVNGDVPPSVARVGVAPPVANSFGRRVRMLGDLDGDGIQDFGISGDDLDGDSEDGTGALYIIYGGSTAGETLANFTDLFPDNGGTGQDGFIISSFSGASFLGKDFYGNGDINGDGHTDLLLLSNNVFSEGRGKGIIFVIYGGKGRNMPALTTFSDLLSMPSDEGFMIVPPVAKADIPNIDFGFENARFVHDMNADGIDEILMCRRFSQFVGTDANGECYLLFGETGTQPFGELFDLGDLLERNGGNGSEGMVIVGSRADECLGSVPDAPPNSADQVSEIGDFDGDEASDLLIGASGCFLAPERAYIVFGQDEYPAELDLRDTQMDGSQSVRIMELRPFAPSESFDFALGVAGVGDVNSDGLHDIALHGNVDLPIDSHGAWVIYGRRDPPNTFNVGALLPEQGGDGSLGFLAQDFSNEESLGVLSISSGDFNGDSVPDIVFGGSIMDPGGRSNAGRAVVLFGRRPVSVDVPALNRWGWTVFALMLAIIGIVRLRRRGA